MDEEKLRENILDKILRSEIKFRNANGEEVEVPESGSLGLLAVGYKGLIAVRKRREYLKLKEKEK